MCFYQIRYDSISCTRQPQCGFPSVLSGTGWEGIQYLIQQTESVEEQSKEQKVGGNLLEGDGMQTGGTYVIDQGGKVLLEFKQDNPADHVDPNEVLKALGIDGKVEVPTGDDGAKAAPVCDGDVCEMPKKS